MKGQRLLLGRRNELIKRSTDFPLLFVVNVSDFFQRLPQQPEHISLSLCIHVYIYISISMCVGGCV